MGREVEDFSATQRFILKHPWLPSILRKSLTPTAVWSAIGALITSLAVSITWLVTTQAGIRKAQDDIQRQDKSIEALQRQGDILNEINTKIAVMGSQIDTIADEVDRQRQWRDKIEGVAELPPHARRKK